MDTVECYRCLRQVTKNKVYSCHGPKVPENTFECVDSKSCNEIYEKVMEKKKLLKINEQLIKNNKIYADQLMEKYGLDFNELKPGGIPCKCIGPKWHRSENHKKEFNGFFDTHGKNGSIHFIKNVPPQYYHLYKHYNIDTNKSNLLKSYPETFEGKIKLNKILQNLENEGYQWKEGHDTEEEIICEYCENTVYHTEILYWKDDSDILTKKIKISQHAKNCPSQTTNYNRMFGGFFASEY